MKLLEILPNLQKHQLIIRKNYQNEFIIRSNFDNNPLVVCNLLSLQMHEFLPYYEDLISDDWELV